MHRSRVAYFVVDVADLDAAVGFWSSALGAVVEAGNPASRHIYRKLRLPDANIRILLQRTADAKTSKERMHLDLETDDVEAELVEAWSVSRESRLFEDIDYGQWGLLLYTPTASADKTAEQCAIRPEDLRESDDLIIGEFLGDAEFLVMARRESGNRKILVAPPIDDRADWAEVGVSLADFLERYLDARGNKFWEPGQNG
ncbi:MAG: hypothetical protein JWM19_3192 [Actinomycetia bacterium]|nr:hypothetical protein [Actinomycetes bacterium]